MAETKDEQIERLERELCEANRRIGTLKAERDRYEVKYTAERQRYTRLCDELDRPLEFGGLA